MTTELTWLCLSAVLAGSLWIPYVIGVNVTNFQGKQSLFTRPPDLGAMQPWVQRAFRAHQNMLEQFLPFAVIVLIGAIARISTPTTAACAIIFFWLRMLHALGMVTGFARFPLRPMIYVSGWILILIDAWQVLARGLVRP